MDPTHYRLMYGYVLQVPAEGPPAGDSYSIGLEKALGEGSRGGKIIGHTPAGKPIYDDGRGTSPKTVHQPSQSEAQRRRTYLPPEGTSAHYADSPSLKGYKNILRFCKQKGLEFQGHVTYDPKKDMIQIISPEGKSMVKQIIADYQAQARPGGSKS